jgi:hypothetical protein
MVYISNKEVCFSWNVSIENSKQAKFNSITKVWLYTGLQYITI